MRWRRDASLLKHTSGVCALQTLAPLANIMSACWAGCPPKNWHHGTVTKAIYGVHMVPSLPALIMVRDVWLGQGKGVNAINTVRTLIIYLKHTVILLYLTSCLFCAHPLISAGLSHWMSIVNRCTVVCIGLTQSISPPWDIFLVRLAVGVGNFK